MLLVNEIVLMGESLDIINSKLEFWSKKLLKETLESKYFELKPKLNISES